jgi:Cof subfamily protein (haloacid dehalogenase superfamily)
VSTPKLLAVDLDGTLLARSGLPHEADVTALCAARDAGVVVTILTGRLIAGTRAAAAALGLNGPIGCADGAHIVDAKTEQTLLHKTIRAEAAGRLQPHFVRSAVSTFLFVGDTVVHDDAGDPHLGYVSGWSERLLRVPNVFEHTAWGDDTGLTAVVAVGDERSIRQTAEAVASQLADHAQVLSFSLSQGGSWGLIARSAGVSKGTALRFIADHAGVAMADTVVVGDWLNDLPMFEAAGRSYAMGQSPDAVRRAATDVLAETSLTGGGIARVVRDAFGIRKKMHQAMD